MYDFVDQHNLKNQELFSIRYSPFLISPFFFGILSNNNLCQNYKDFFIFDYYLQLLVNAYMLPPYHGLPYRHGHTIKIIYIIFAHNMK